MIRARDAAEDVGEACKIPSARRLKVGERPFDSAQRINRRRIVALEAEPAENGHDSKYGASEAPDALG